MSALLEKQKAALVELEQRFTEMFSEAPFIGHGGTPFVDNSTGRMRRKQCDKYQESLRSMNDKIKAQKEKIEKTESRIAYRTTQTKKSAKFLEKNGISPVLLELEKQGKIKQWARNPEYFFVNGLERVALKTFEGKVGISARFPSKTQADYDFCLNLIRSVGV